eukprot:scaffold29073_cov184-Amphora_coffeaeformis.AAC.2
MPLSSLFLRMTQLRCIARPSTVSIRRMTAPSKGKPKEAGKWLTRMAPPKGGTERPDAPFLVVAAVVCGAGYYAWFIDPPQQQAKAEEHHQKAGETPQAKED